MMNLNKIKALKENHMFYSMVKMIMGSGFARLLGILSIPVITRIYEPKDLGLASTFIAIILIVAPMLSLRYVTAIPLPKTQIMALNVFQLSLILILIFSFIVFVLLLLFHDYILDLLNLTEMSSLWMLLVFSILAVALYELLSMWATREQEFNVLAKTKVTQAIFGELSKIGLGLIGLKPVGLLIGHTMEQSSGILSLLLSFKSKFFLLRKHVNKKRMNLVLIRYKDFPIFRLPSQFFLIFSMQAPILISSLLYTKEITGLLSLALLSIGIPIAIFGNPIGQVFYGKVASLKGNTYKEIKLLAVNIQKKLLILSVPLCIFLIVFGEFIFNRFFGGEWSKAGGYASTLAPIIIFQMLSSPLIQILNLYGSQLIFLLINIVRFIGLFFIYLICKNYQLNSHDFVIFLSLFLCFFYGICIFYVNFMVFKNANK